MRHLRLTLQYDGTEYSGWQIQDKGRTIQGVVEEAVSTITGESTRVTGASRTDAGVHAIEQVASFRTGSALSIDVFKRALNANLPPDIRVLNVLECPEYFHPRYSAKSKTYSYFLSYGSLYPVFLRRYLWHVPYPLARGIDVMKEAAGYIVGEHDFSSFQASGCSSKNAVRRVFSINVSEHPLLDFMGFKFNVPAIKISITANAFLRHMARNIVGTLVEVARGKITPASLKEILESKDRRHAGPTAPPTGLFLENIQY
jgi:tRNA pseudouridine38-40 synthase